MIRIFTVKEKKTSAQWFAEKVNRELGSLAENNWKVLNTQIIETEEWDYPEYVPTLCCLITAELENK